MKQNEFAERSGNIITTEYLQKIVDQLSVPIYIIDTGTYEIIQTNNPQHIEKLGRPCYEVLHDLDQPCSSSEHICGIRESCEKKESVVHEHIHTAPDGGRQIVEVHTHPIFDADGEVSLVIEYCFDITEKQENAQSLRAFFHAIEQSPISIVITDPDGNIEYVNAKFSQTTGYSVDEVLGENPRILKDPEKPSSDYLPMWNELSSGKTWKGEFHNRRKDGSFYLESAVISPVFNEKKEIQNYIALKEDITRQKTMAEQILLQSKAMDESTSIITIVNAEHYELPVIYVNRAFEKRTGYSSGEVLGRNLRFLHGDDNRQEGLNTLRRAIREEQAADCLIRNYRKDGSLFWNELTITPMRNEKGELTHYVGISNDVTEFQRIQKELMDSEERLRMSHSFAKIGTWDYDIPGGVLHWSEGVPPLFGIRQNQLSMDFNAFLELVHPDDRQHLNEEIQKCMEDHTAFRSEYRCVWPDASIHWLQADGNVFRDESDKPVRMLGVVQDITGRKTAEKELMMSREEAYRANRAKSEFLSSMSHELRTPMNAIIGFSQLLEMDTSLNDDQRDNIHEILKAGNHLLELINEVLDLSKIELGRVDLSLEALNYKNILDDVMKLIRPMAKKKEISIELENREDIFVSADLTRLKQVLVNLFSNAVKYNRVGGKITAKITRHSGAVRLSISDTGEGIPEHKLKGLFEPFNRLGADRREIEGTGIGLTISKRLVELMGGTIGVESVVSMGSTFWIDLTGAEKPDHSGPVETDKSEQAAPLREIRQRHTVLYIEDNPSNLRLMEHIVRRLDQVTLLTSQIPSEGLKLAETHEPDLFLVDLNLPEMDGYAVLQHIRKSPWGTDVPVVAVSANAMPQDIQKGLSAGFTFYLTKPLDISNTLKVINDLLSSRNDRQNKKSNEI